ncbi:MAG: OmpA family protein [Bacteroidota bacterium]
MKKHFLFFAALLLVLTTYAQNTATTAGTAHLKVWVTDFKNKSRPNEAIIFKDVKTLKIFESVSGKDGRFEIDIPDGARYRIMFRNFSDIEDYMELDVEKSKGGTPTYELQVLIEPAKTFTLKNVLFDTGKATLKASSNEALNNLVQILKIKSTMVIELAGHTDNVGDPQSNLKLSQDRAEAVRNYLISKGIAANRITAKGYGDTQPVADNSTAEGKQQNRRTEVNVIKE